MRTSLITLGEAAKYIGITPKYLQILDRKGKFKAHRTITNKSWDSEGVEITRPTERGDE